MSLRLNAAGTAECPIELSKTLISPLTSGRRDGDIIPQRLIGIPSLLWLFAAVFGFAVGCDEPAKDAGNTSAETVSSADADSGSANTPADSGHAAVAAVENTSGLRFEDRTPDAVRAHVYRNGEEADHVSILESLGGGAAVIDFDADGREDICFAGGGRFEGQQILPIPTGLFRQTGDWNFTNVSATAAVTDNRFYSHGIARADFDDDGFQDFAVTGYGGVDLYQNLGDGTFRRIDSDSIGLVDPTWSSSAAWGDLNGDGWLDLFIVHYVNWSFDNHPFCKGPEPGQREICPPRVLDGLRDAVFLSRGDGTFDNATDQMGITPEGKGLGIVIADFDNDRDNDVYVGNDTVANFLYRNDDEQALTDVSLKSGASLGDNAVPDGSMGVNILDFNNDGLPELWVVNFERESSALYVNLNRMLFLHASRRTGVYAVGQLYVGWGTTCQDFDLDGDEDMFVSNGHVIRFPLNAPIMQRPLLFENQHGERVTEIGASLGPYFQEQHMGRGAVAADFDRDGDPDIAISRTNQPAIMLENLLPDDRPFLHIRLRASTNGRDAIGSSVVLTSEQATQTRWVKGGGSYASTESEWLCFGMRPDDRPTELTVRWKSGATQTVLLTGTERRLTLIEPRTGNDGRVLADVQ